MDITTQFEPTVAEIREACARNAAKARRMWWVNMLIGLVGGTGLLILGIAVDPESNVATLQIVVGVVLVLFGAWHLMLLRSGVSLAADRSAARLCTPTVLRMSADRYSFELPTEKGEVLWELTRIIISQDAWTFAANNRVNLILPKRALSTQDQAAFTNFVAGRDPKLVKTA